MRLVAMASALLFTTAIPAVAADIGAFETALRQLPETVLAKPDPALAHFVDMTVVRRLAGETELTPRSLNRAQLATLMRPVEALRAAGPQVWAEKAGISPEAVQYFLSFGKEPQKVTVWGLQNEAAATDLMAGLSERGFVSLDEEVFGNGKPLAMDPAKRDTGNPWRSKVGAASFVMAKGASILQAATPEAVISLRAEIPGAANNPFVATALAGLATVTDGQAVVQAILVSPVFGMKGLDPALLLSKTKDVKAIQKILLDEIQSGSGGIPPYMSGIIADISSDRPTVAISLAYGDCTTAERTAELMAMQWVATMPEPAQGTMQTGFTPYSANLCAATLTIAGDKAAPSINPIFSAFLHTYMRGSFKVLQIGEANTGGD